MDEKLKAFLKQQEGFQNQQYTDQTDNPTIGYGSKMTSPEVPDVLQDMGVDPATITSGERQLTPEQADQLQNKQIEEKQKYFNNIKKQDFPHAEIKDNENTALMSLMYNNPQLVGPDMRQQLENNDKIAVAKEILLRSNKAKDAGLQKRRLDEAAMYSGETFPDVINSLNDDEKSQIRTILGNIQNVNERERVLNQYPFLREMAPNPILQNLMRKQYGK